MKRCLRERELVLLQADDGTADQRRHLRDCAACAARVRRLADDLALVGRALQDEPPDMSQAAGGRRIWAPAAATALAVLLVMNLLFAWQWSRMRSPEVAPMRDAPSNAAVMLGVPATPLDAPQFIDWVLEMPSDDFWLNEDLQSLPLGDIES